MPKYTSQDGFDDDMEAPTGTLKAAEQEDEPGDRDDSPEYAPIVAPKSAFMGRELNVGDIITFRVEAVHDDSYSMVCDESGTENSSDEAGADDQGRQPEGYRHGAPDADEFD